MLQFSVHTTKHRLDRPKSDSRCFNFTFLVTFEENGLRLKDKHNIVGIRSLNFFGILRTQELVRLANFLENVLKRNMEEKLIKVACGAQLNSRHCWRDKTREFFFNLGSYTTWHINCFPNNLNLQSSMLSYEICGGVLTAS